MRRTITTTLTLLAALALLPSAAHAVVTASNITAPSGNPVVLDPDRDAASSPVQVSGTATASPGDDVDIYCLHTNKTEATNDAALATNVPVNGGTFAATIDANDFRYFICELVAVPAGSGLPANTGPFTGPVVSNNGFEIEREPTSPNPIFDYNQNSSTRGGYWSVYSAGDCFVFDSYPLEAATLTYDDDLFGCSWIDQAPASPGDPVLLIDGQPSRLPYEQSAGTVFLGIEDFQHSVDSQGLMHISDSEPVVTCGETCATQTDSGVRVRQRQDGIAGGQSLRILQRWTNLTDQPRQLVIPYAITIGPNDPGWRFPGESDFTARAEGDSVVSPAGGPGSVLISENAPSTCPDVFDHCGAVTWFEPPQNVTFSETDRMRFSYSLTIPPNGSELVGFTYSHGFPLTSVENLARDAEAGFDTSFKLGKLKRNTKKGTAKLAVTVPGSGQLTLAGKGLKNAARTPSEAGRVQLPVKPKGKAKKQLKRKGKAKLKASVTYTRTDLEPATQQQKLKLKQKRKRRR